jgi:hypothetical protein
MSREIYRPGFPQTLTNTEDCRMVVLVGFSRCMTLLSNGGGAVVALDAQRIAGNAE